MSLGLKGVNMQEVAKANVKLRIVLKRSISVVLNYLLMLSHQTRLLFRKSQQSFLLLLIIIFIRALDWQFYK